jgi:hypothetical protein
MRQIAGLQQQEEKLDAVELRHGPEQGQDARSSMEMVESEKVCDTHDSHFC